jgi:hypothetical protein
MSALGLAIGQEHRDCSSDGEAHKVLVSRQAADCAAGQPYNPIKGKGTDIRDRDANNRQQDKTPEDRPETGQFIERSAHTPRSLD